MVAQFTPYSWVEFDWRPLSSFKRWAAMMGVICIVSIRTARPLPLFARIRSTYQNFYFIVSDGRTEHLLPQVRLVDTAAQLDEPYQAHILPAVWWCRNARDF